MALVMGLNTNKRHHRAVERKLVYLTKKLNVRPKRAVILVEDGPSHGSSPRPYSREELPHCRPLGGAEGILEEHVPWLMMCRCMDATWWLVTEGEG